MGKLGHHSDRVVSLHPQPAEESERLDRTAEALGKCGKKFIEYHRPDPGSDDVILLVSRCMLDSDHTEGPRRLDQLHGPERAALRMDITVRPIDPGVDLGLVQG